MMDAVTLEKVLRRLRREVRKWKVPAVGKVAQKAADRPFETLVGTMLSLRTKDAVTERAAGRLLARASTPASLAALPLREIERLIYPVGFYRTKAKNLKETCRILVERHGGHVPRTMEELLELPGVGRKTANLVLTVGHDEYGICVDTHVHRIVNLWGYVKTRRPAESETALRRKLPKKHWKSINDILVTFGQNLCVPVSPWCSRCPIEEACAKVGLKHRR